MRNPIYCVKITPGALEQAATDAWLAENAKGWVTSSVAQWSDVTKTHHNRGGGLWNMSGGVFTPGARHVGHRWTENLTSERDYVWWSFEQQREAKAFQKEFGGEAFTR